MFTSEFITYIKEHSDLWISYWLSLFSGAGGVTLMIANPIWEWLGIIGGLALTFVGIVSGIVVTMKAWWGYKKVKLEVREKELVLKEREQRIKDSHYGTYNRRAKTPKRHR
jgi:Na+/melibiose symporter-like transporter